jgi:hypothetical protein
MGGYGMDPGPSVMLPVGTLLRDGVGGPVVGRVVVEQRVSGELVGGSVTFSRSTPWGTAELTASPTDILWTDDDMARTTVGFGDDELE